MTQRNQYSGANPWPDERVEELKTLHAEGLSFGQIARTLGGVSRNACIGKARRLGLVARVGNVGAATRKANGARTRPAKSLALPPPPPSEPEPLMLEDGSVVTMANVGFIQCRWPRWSDTEHESFRVCGHVKELGSPYCLYHRHRAAGAGTSSERGVTKPPIFKTWETV